MRYIYAVAGLILIVLGITGITFLKTGPPASKELARVNERTITVDEFQKKISESRNVSPSELDRRRFLDDLLTRELLIQEAKKRGLDLKEPFRRSIQNYYEQTLIKGLTQERMSEIHVTVSEEEIAEYYKNMGKIFELRIAALPTEDEANEAVRNFPAATAQKRKLRMEEIPPELSAIIGSLRVGEVSRKPFPCYRGFCTRGFFIFRLEGHESMPLPPLAKVHDEIGTTLGERKKQAEMEHWLEGLKNQSKVTINEALLK